MTIDHIDGAVSAGIVESEEKAVGLRAELENGLTSGAGDVFGGPGLQAGDLSKEVLGIGGMIDIPDALLDSLESIFQVFSP